jgi:hypothetical protein
MKIRPHNVFANTLVKEESPVFAFALTEGVFEGIIFSFKHVSVIDKEDHAKLSYEYDIHHIPDDKKQYDKEVFEKELGDFLTELIECGIEHNKLGFFNVSKDRENDSFESDSQRGLLP